MRLIDADALQESVVELLDLAIKRVEDTPNDSPCYRMYVAQENERSRFIDLIDNAPTVELVMSRMSNGVLIPVRLQGEWLKSDVPESVLAKCSICGFDCGSYTNNYCPNCGAKMKDGAE